MTQKQYQEYFNNYQKEIVMEIANVDIRKMSDKEARDYFERLHPKLKIYRIVSNVGIGFSCIVGLLILFTPILNNSPIFR